MVKHNEATSPASPASSGSPTALPEEWEELFDEAKELPYYYNKTTHETSWERPAGKLNNTVAVALWEK